MSDGEHLPEPLVPAHVDLRGYQFMPLYGDVLFRSAFNVRATDAEFRAAMNLWWAAWWEVPAASLPNNERDLCRLAGLKSIRQWRKVRALVMEKWVLCADDRWYLPFLADLSTDAFSKRVVASAKGRNGAKKRWGINGSAHATGNSTGNATAINTNSPGNAPATKSDSTGNSNRSEVNTPLPPIGNSTSTPKAAAHSIAKAQQAITEGREAAARAAAPPGGLTPSEFLKQAAKAPVAFEDTP